MKQFFKTVLAVIVAMLIMSIINMIMWISMIVSLGAGASTKKTEITAGSALLVDMSKITLAEQSQDMSMPAISLMGGMQNQPQQIGILDAVNALRKAQEDKRIDYIYIKADGAAGGMAQLEEFRQALVDFKQCGKPVLAYTEAASNGSYYIASAADKVLMSSCEGATNTLVGVSSQLYFLKDVLDKFGVNVQLIRHGKYKSAGEMYIKNDISPENRLQYETFIGSIWRNMSADICASRDLSVERFNEMLDNLELNVPEDFLKAGLVDELVDRAALESKLAAYCAVTDFKDAKFASFGDYVAANATVASPLKSKVAVIYVDGEIVDGSEKQQVAGDRFAKIVNDVRRDKTVKAVVFRVNSPGGSVLASEKIKNEVDRLCAEKPVIASYANYAASGGYWISNNCREIYSDKTTLTGSIGVFSMIPDLSKTVKDFGHVNVVSINSNKHGDMYSLMRPLDKQELDYMQQSVEVIYDKFVNIVAQGRGLEPDFVDSIAQGRVWAGTDALEIGLVDKIGTLDDALHAVAEMIDDESTLSSYEVVAFPKPLTMAETILEMISGEESVLARRMSTRVFSGTPFEGIETAFRNFKATQSGKVYARLPYAIEIK